MAVTVAFSDRAEIVLDAVGAWLGSHPVANNLMLSLLANRVAHPQPGRYWIVSNGGAPLGVVLQSPNDFPAIITPMPENAVVAAVTAMADAGVELPGVNGEAAAAARFAGEWSERKRTAAEPFNGQRIYELKGAPSSNNARGRLRPAEVGDADLILQWLRAFHAYTGSGVATLKEVTRRVASGHFWLWDDDQGPCSMAAQTDPIAGVVRIQAVFTPPARRERGYAGGTVSTLSARLQAEGHRCILYADLANPASNSLYRRIGYQAVGECLRYRFACQTAAGPV